MTDDGARGVGLFLKSRETSRMPKSLKIRPRILVVAEGFMVVVKC
jgi:hypothetical protein